MAVQSLLMAALGATVPLVHAPVVVLQVLSARHVTLGAGVPKNPLLQVAVQFEPAVVFAAQLNAPPSGFTGGVLHTARRMAVK